MSLLATTSRLVRIAWQRTAGPARRFGLAAWILRLLILAPSPLAADSAAQDRSLAGKFTLQMDIAPSGRVGSLVVASDTIGNVPLQKCMKAPVKNCRFPKVDEDTVLFTLPLVFIPPE